MALRGFFPLSTVAYVIHLYGQPPSGQLRVYRIAPLRTDGVHPRKSAGTRSVVLKMSWSDPVRLILCGLTFFPYSAAVLLVHWTLARYYVLHTLIYQVYCVEVVYLEGLR